METGHAADSGFLLQLTVDDIRAIQHARHLEKQKMLESAARIEALDARLNAIKILVDEQTRETLFGEEGSDQPDSFDQKSSGAVSTVPTRRKSPPPPVVKGMTRSDWLMDLMGTQEGGLTEAEIWERIKASPLPGLVGETDRATRRLLEYLTRRGKLRRRGPIIIHPDVLDRVGETAMPPDARRRGTKALLENTIKRILADVGRAKSGDIVARLWAIPEVSENLKPRSQYPLNILSQMALAGDLDRDGKFYTLPSDTAETAA